MASILVLLAQASDVNQQLREDVAALNAATGDCDNPIRAAVSLLNSYRHTIEKQGDALNDLRAGDGIVPPADTPLTFAIRALLAQQGDDHMRVRWLKHRGWLEYPQGWRTKDLADFFTLRGASDIQLRADLNPVQHLKP